MSYGVHISTTKSLLPSLSQWNQAIAAKGFDLMIQDLVWEEVGGAVPMRLQGRDVSVEMGIEQSESPKRLLGLVPSKRTGQVKVSAYFGSSSFELASGLVAMALLREMCGGGYSDDDNAGMSLEQQLQEAQDAYVRALIFFRLLSSSEVTVLTDPRLEKWETADSRAAIVRDLVAEKTLVEVVTGDPSRCRFHVIRGKAIAAEFSQLEGG